MQETGLFSAIAQRWIKRLVKPASSAVAVAVQHSQKGLGCLEKALRSKIHIEIELVIEEDG